MADLAAVARRYARLRWIGIGLFWISLILFGALVLAVAAYGLPPYRLMLGFLCMGLSLGSFGTASDTALWAMRELRSRNQLPPEFRKEWQQEVSLRADRIRGLHAAPRMALLMPILAMGAQGMAVYRILEVCGS